MAWLQLTFEVSRDHAEAAETLLEELGAMSVTLTDAVPAPESVPLLEPPPGAMPRWQRNRVAALFHLDSDYDAIGKRLRADGLEVTGFAVDFLEDADWENRWRQFAVPVRFADRLWVIPRDAPTPEEAGAVLRLDPGLAFGSGSHPTTRLCLGWLADASLTGRRVLDFGCGSGILALAARALGADEVWGVDHDAQALLATRENAAYNGLLDDRLRVGEPAMLRGAGEFDVIVANILANPLIELAPQITQLTGPGGMVVLSGLLAEQAESVAAAYPLIGFGDPVLEKDEQGGAWVRLAGQRLAHTRPIADG